MMPVLNRLLRYGVVGGTAAAVHIGVLLLLGRWMSLSLANPIAFLAASVAGYLGHALLTFREETEVASSPVAGCCAVRREYQRLRTAAAAPGLDPGAGVHAHGAKCSDLEPSSPIQCEGLSAQERDNHRCSTPTTWLAKRRGFGHHRPRPKRTASGGQSSANGLSAAHAVEAWRDLADPPPLTLHLCLTEGMARPTARICRPDSAACCWPPPAMAAPTHRPPVAHGSAAADRPLPPAHGAAADPPRWPPTHPPRAAGDGCGAGSVPFRIDHLGAHDAGSPAGRSVAPSLVAQPQTGGLIKWLVLQLLSRLAIPVCAGLGLKPTGASPGCCSVGRCSEQPFGAAGKRLIAPSRAIVLHSPLF